MFVMLVMLVRQEEDVEEEGKQEEQERGYEGDPERKRERKRNGGTDADVITGTRGNEGQEIIQGWKMT